jgi:hypothetical protein
MEGWDQRMAFGGGEKWKFDRWRRPRQGDPEASQALKMGDHAIQIIAFDLSHCL